MSKPQNRIVIRAKVQTREQTDNAQSDERYEFGAEISNDLLDSYHSYMDESTLKNFRDDSKAGVAFLEGHNNRLINYGRTFGARIQNLDDRKRVITDIYTIRDINFSGNMSFASTNDFIRAVEKNLVNDVSVGFYGGEFICDLCDRELFDFWAWLMDDRETEYCEHIPGATYENADGKKEVATYTIYNANLSEVSVVYDGATPEAQITKKARALYEGGALDRKAIYGINDLYNLRMAPEEWDALTIGDKRSLVSHKTKGGVSHMDLMEMIKSASIDGLPTDDTESAVRWLIDKHGTLGTDLEQSQDRANGLETENTTLKASNSDLESTKKLNTDLGKSIDVVRGENKDLREKVGVLEKARDLDKDITTRNGELKTKNEELTGQVDTLTTEKTELEKRVTDSEEMAKLGQETRDNLIEATLESGVRAYGDEFDKEEQKTVLENMNLNTVRSTKETWDEVGDKRFPDGRQTSDDGDPPDPAPTRFVEPDELYGIRTGGK